MTGKEFKQLQPGDQFRVDWCKDGDSYDMRLNKTLFTICEVTNGIVYVSEDPGYEFYHDTVIEDDCNDLDSGRGLMYLYHP